MVNFRVEGVGMYVPERVLTNEEVENLGIGAKAEWIYKNTGVQNRRIADKSQATSDLAANAAQEAMENAGIRPQDIDLIVMSTVTADFITPHTSAIIKHKIKAVNAACYDIQAGCAGFVFGIITGINYAQANQEISNILVIGADVLSRITDWTDKKACSIVGDGAGAFIIRKTDSGQGLKSSYIYHECMDSVSRGYIPAYYGDIPEHSKIYYSFDGRYLYERSIKYIPKVVNQLLAKASWKAGDVDLFIFTQVNKSLILDVLKQLDVDETKTHMIMDRYGYTSNSCIPLAVYDAVKSNRIKEGCKVVILGAGAGSYSACIALEW
ncbi:MAG: ketoacyl-ACP synthase III [Clostridia bacterium]|nr:ketoacyl-ACP synthase III [Clostridia bacterium]